MRDAMMMVSEHDIERVAWSSSDNGGAIAGERTKPYSASRPTFINTGASKVRPVLL